MKNTIELPEATRKRMVQLCQILKNWTDIKITSRQICEMAGWKDSLIRHDFWLLGYNKGVSNGYIAEDLLKKISAVLGFETSETNNETVKSVCITGLGRLGAALLDNSILDSSLFRIKAGFDSNVNRVEILRSVFPLYPASEMAAVIKREKIEYAILTVADKDAQSMLNRLVSAGIKGIINMTNVVLKVPEGVKIENLSVLNALKLVI